MAREILPVIFNQGSNVGNELITIVMKLYSMALAAEHNAV